jgi:hypothetical protein
VEADNGKQAKRGLSLQAICEKLETLTGGLPKRVDKTLFVLGANYTPRWLKTTAELFAWLDERAFVNWGGGADMISQARLLAHLRESAEQFDAVEQFPHWPPLPRRFYLHPPLPDTDGRHLKNFLAFFDPLTEADGELLKAFAMMLVWGGAYGARPAWVFTTPGDDRKGGRGVGKSKCVELFSELVGGMLEFSTKDDIGSIKTRLLSPAARTSRVCRLDNLKSMRLSWPDLESIITSPLISGHEMWQGEGRKPNSLTWALTLNGASMSRDMAQRVIVVNLLRPVFGPYWESNVRNYIHQYRWHILNDIRLLLES